MEFTIEKVAQDYLNLSNPNPQISQKANSDLNAFRVFFSMA